MKNIINFNRLGKLIKKDLKDNKERILIFVSIMVAVSILKWLVSFVFSTDIQISAFNRISTINTLVFITMIAMPFRLYHNSNHRMKGIDYATLPVTVTEKYVTMIFISFIVIPLSVLLLTIGFDYLMSLITPSLYSETLFGSSDIQYYLSWQKIGEYLATIFMGTGIVLYGNLLFRTNKVLYTLLSIFIINIIIATIVVVMIKNGVNIFELIGMENIKQGDKYIITLGEHGSGFRIASTAVKYIVVIGIPTLLYFLSFRRLKSLNY